MEQFIKFMREQADIEAERRKKKIEADFTPKECWSKDFFIKNKILHYTTGKGEDTRLAADGIVILIDPETGVNYFAPFSRHNGYLGFFPRYNTDGSLMVTHVVPSVEPSNTPNQKTFENL